MPKKTLDEIDQLIRQIRPTNCDLVRRDIIQAINSTTSTLKLNIASYYYNNGTSKELLCLQGTVICLYKGNQYNIPIEIILQQDHPIVPPLAYVKPTLDMYISSSSNVRPDGTVIIPYLRNWRHPNSKITGLLNAMSEAFSQSPPVYSNAGFTNYSTPYQTSVSLMTPKTALSISHSLSTSVASNNVEPQKYTHRFSDIVAEPQRMLLPIQGFDKMPLVSLEEAVIPLVSFVSDVEQMVWIAKQNCTNPKDGLTSDESASIMLYTMEWEPYEKSFYVIFNTALRAANREELKPWFLYLRLIIKALDKLPSTSRSVYRGVKLDLSDQYRLGSTVAWWGFSSCTLSIDTLSNERFLGKSGSRTFFTIECDSGKNIRSHSYYEKEDEVLLLPARQFQVIGSLDQGNGLHIIQLKEIQPKFPLIKLNSS